MNDRSTEALLARRALAEMATPGPWASYVNVKATFGVKAHDWGQVYARVGEHVWAILSMNLNRLSPAEEAEARTALREGRGIDPGQPGRDAAFIASNPPETVMADIDEILRLRAEVARLEKEADWLAQTLANECPVCGSVRYLNYSLNVKVRIRPTAGDWREAARKAMEGNNGPVL